MAGVAPPHGGAAGENTEEVRAGGVAATCATAGHSGSGADHFGGRPIR
ncbi:hypothetical protein PUR34_05955 [Streptomyces sp. JV185]|nr:hypothetical protein [Streptomyces sp. JV185]MEE1767732.1 hypothetical protein [Streptomyces sp. JV185]